MGERLTRELDLTEEQRARIDSIVRHQAVQLREINEESRPRVRAVVRETREQIDSVLTTEQRERMREMRRAPGRRGSPR